MKEAFFAIQRRILFLFVITLFFIFPSPAGSADAGKPETLNIGLIPEINIFEQLERYEPLGQYIAARIGVPVVFKILSRYGNIIDRFKSMQLDGAFFGSFTGAMAIEKLGLLPVARPVNPDGESTYYGLIFSRKDGTIRTVGDLRGRRFAFVERATTAGYVFPLAYLRRNGVKELDGFFSEYYFAGSHDATIYDVFNGLADAGAAKNTVFQRVAAKNPKIMEALHIVATSKKVPSNGLCVADTVPKTVRTKLRDILLGMDKRPPGQKILKILGAIRFVETTRESYAPVMEMAERAGISVRDYSYLNQ